jgi:hypothetical protein
LRNLEEAVRIIYLIDSLWPGSPCAYLFETVDATNHPQEDVRDEFNNVVKRILGPGVSFEPLVVSSDAYRTCRLWTNLAPAPLISEMMQEAGSYAFHTNDSSMVHPGTLSLWDDPYALETERERQLMDTSTWIGPSVTEVDGHPLLKSTMDIHALTFTIGGAMCFQHVLLLGTRLFRLSSTRSDWIVCHFRMLPNLPGGQVGPRDVEEGFTHEGGRPLNNSVAKARTG